MLVSAKKWGWEQRRNTAAVGKIPAATLTSSEIKDTDPDRNRTDGSILAAIGNNPDSSAGSTRSQRFLQGRGRLGVWRPFMAVARP